MFGFNVRVNFLASGISVSIDGNPVESKDIQEFFEKIAAKPKDNNQPIQDSEPTADQLPKTELNKPPLKSSYSQAAKDFWDGNSDLSGIFDPVIQIVDDAFKNKVPKPKDLIPLTDIDFESLKTTFEGWEKKPTSFADMLDEVKAKTNEATQANLPKTFGVFRIYPEAKFTINKLTDLNQIPNFFGIDNQNSFSYYHGAEPLNREDFMQRIFQEFTN